MPDTGGQSRLSAIVRVFSRGMQSVSSVNALRELVQSAEG